MNAVCGTKQRAGAYARAEELFAQAEELLIDARDAMLNAARLSAEALIDDLPLTPTEAELAEYLLSADYKDEVNKAVNAISDLEFTAFDIAGDLTIAVEDEKDNAQWRQA